MTDERASTTRHRRAAPEAAAPTVAATAPASAAGSGPVAGRAVRRSSDGPDLHQHAPGCGHDRSPLVGTRPQRPLGG